MSGSTTGIVAFDATYFAARFPEFSTVSETLIGYYFAEAGQYLNNTATSVISDASVGGRRYILLHLLTAHLAALYAGVNGSAASQMVGRISGATQGSVSVSSDIGVQPMAAAWYMQTKYGAAYWAATFDLRTATYIGGRRWSGYCG